MPASGKAMRANPKVARFGIDVEKPILLFAPYTTTQNKGDKGDR